MIGRTISHYTITEKLGEGGMGVVYKAEDIRLKRTVALKFLRTHLLVSEADKSRLVREAQAAASLDHPNIGTIYEIDEVDGMPFIAMAFIEGQSLSARIHTGPLPQAEAADIARQIASGLQAAHAKGIVHRDIKSANVMITPDGIAKIMDFGLARAAGHTKLTADGMTLGTLAYMAPEQARSEEVDHRADIWALGVIMYEMLAGKLPFISAYDQALIYLILNENPPAVSDLSPAIEQVVQRCLRKNRAERYQEAAGVLADLSPATGTAPRQQPRTRPRALRWAAAIAVAVLAIAAAVILLNRGNSPERRDVPKNSLAVMYFDNQSGEKDLDKMLISLLTTNLARDKDLVVASDQRLFDILKTLGSGKSIDRGVATEVARRAHVRTMVLGSIIRIGSQLRITAQLLDVDTGDIIGSDQANGSRIDDLFPMVDDLTRQIIGNFHIGGGQQLNIADVSTHSIEAYRSYREGLEHLWRWEPDRAEENFTKAIAIDSSFALAFVQLAVAKSNLGLGIVNPFADLSGVRMSLDQATKYLPFVTEKERDYVTLYSAMYMRDFQRADSLAIIYAARNPDDAQAMFALAKASWLADSSAAMFRALERVLEIDPTFAIAYNELAYSYTYRGEYARAVSTIKKRLSLQRDVSDAYDSGVEVYVQSGLFDEARDLCEKGLRQDSTWTGLLSWEATIALFQGDGARARSIIGHRPSHDAETDAEKDRELCYVDVHEGRYRDAIARMERWLHFAQAKKWTRARMFARLDLGRINAARGNYSSAVEEFRKAAELSAGAYPPSANPIPVMAAYNIGVALVREGDVAGALSQAATLRTLVMQGRDVTYYINFYHMLLAEVYLNQGNGAAARSELDSVSRLVQEGMPHGRAVVAATLGAQGRIDSAIHAYELSMNKTSGRYFSGYCEFMLERSRTFYRIGTLYEQEGNRGKAREYYTKAIAQWKEADAPELIDARRRLRSLQKPPSS